MPGASDDSQSKATTNWSAVVADEGIQALLAQGEKILERLGEREGLERRVDLVEQELAELRGLLAHRSWLTRAAAALFRGVGAIGDGVLTLGHKFFDNKIAVVIALLILGALLGLSVDTQWGKFSRGAEGDDDDQITGGAEDGGTSLDDAVAPGEGYVYGED